MHPQLGFPALPKGPLGHRLMMAPSCALKVHTPKAHMGEGKPLKVSIILCYSPDKTPQGSCRKVGELPRLPDFHDKNVNHFWSHLGPNLV